MTAAFIDKVKNIFGKPPKELKPLNQNISQNKISQAQVIPTPPPIGPKPSTGETQAGFISKQLAFLSSKFGSMVPLNKIASPIIKVLDEDIVSAKITRETYIPKDQRKKNIDDYLLDEKNTTDNVCIYYNPTTKICIIGYRGTVATEYKDLSSDAQIVLDVQGLDPRVKNALDVYDTARREYQGYKFQVCGHSLGGTLSYIVARHRNPSRCVVFNPGAFLSTSFVKMLEDTKRHVERANNTYTYRILGDLISSLAFVGHTSLFSIKSADPLKLHTVDNFKL